MRVERAVDKNHFLEKCIICDSGRIQYNFISNGYPLCQCCDCEFMFLNPQPPDEVLAKIYNSNYFLMGDSERSEEIRTEMKRATAQLYFEELRNYYGEGRGRLLEIGCGNGDFLVLAKERGFDVRGIEISQNAAGIANKKLGDGCVSCGALEEIELPEEFFDICVLFDVIEHVRDPIRYLKRIHRVLKFEGVVFIVTPSLDSWSAKIMRNNWMEFKAEHLHYFNRQTIQNALNKTGFQDAYVSPNIKYLKIEYIRSHFERYRVPILSAGINTVGYFLPEKIKRNNFRFSTSGMNIKARKGKVADIPMVSIIIPVYNEAGTFPVLIKRLIEKEIKGLRKEIIIVESKSNDGSREEVLKYRGMEGIKVVLEEKARGKGHAVRNGLQYAEGDFVMIQDGDLEYDLNDYEQLLEPLRKHQRAFILGSRHSNSWKMRQFESQPFVALVMNIGQKFFTALLNLFCWQNLKDPFTMYKVFRRDCLFGLRLKANRFDFDWEIVIKLLRKGYIPLEIPVNYKSRSFKDGKKVSIIRDPLLWILALFKYRFGNLYEAMNRKSQATLKDHTGRGGRIELKDRNVL